MFNVKSEWVLEILFRILQFFFFLTYLALACSIGWIRPHDFEEWVDEKLDDYYAQSPSPA